MLKYQFITESQTYAQFLTDNLYGWLKVKSKQNHLFIIDLLLTKTNMSYVFNISPFCTRLGHNNAPLVIVI